MKLGRLLFPQIRWSDESGFSHESESIERALDAGVGGFIIFGGPAERVKELTNELHANAPHPLLIGADLERGAGQQFRGATSLPPLAAIGVLDDEDVSRRAGELTAREAHALGINWIFAPVADVDLEPRNPIVGTRSFGTRAEDVARQVRAWTQGCHAGGALACAKHFPGHGRTTADSHTELPRVSASRVELEQDLLPFRAAIDAGVDSIMSAHVAFSALDDAHTPATLSHRIITELLREELHFDGIVVTDAMNMAGVLEGGAASATVGAIRAGCDALLFAQDIPGMTRALENAIGDTLKVARVEQAIARIDAAAQRSVSKLHLTWGGTSDAKWTLDVALRSLRVTRGSPVIGGDRIEVVTIDDDEGGPHAPPARTVLPHVLAEAGVDVRTHHDPDDRLPTIIAVYADIRAWKGRPGLSAGATEAVQRAVDAARHSTVVLFGHERLASELPGKNVLTAWGGEPLMQEAAAVWLARSR
jgi:beta-glucosidase-like glycosyl hydrolase